MVLLKGKPYADRRQAARLLGKSLAGYETYHPLILGIPRGGVVVADTIARALKTDLDIVLIRKLGAPGNPELAIGAISESGRIHLQHDIAEKVGADEDYIEQEIARQLAEIEARRQRYRNVLPKVSLEGRTVILVDDGVATGATMQASLWAVGCARTRRRARPCARKGSTASRSTLTAPGRSSTRQSSTTARSWGPSI